tara:strand:- start:86378 stop:86677 length:300 start_codon:yes stop_codon:yes gene_type:complete
MVSLSQMQIHKFQDQRPIYSIRLQNEIKFCKEDDRQGYISVDIRLETAKNCQSFINRNAVYQVTAIRKKDHSESSEFSIKKQERICDFTQVRSGQFRFP